MDYPTDLLYHPEHAWAKIEGEVATFGITHRAQDQLGEVVFFEPPGVGSAVTKDTPYAEIESSKALSDVFAPLTGEVIEVNDDLRQKPEIVNQDPHGAGWMIKVKITDPKEADALLDAASYQELTAS